MRVLSTIVVLGLAGSAAAQPPGQPRLDSIMQAYFSLAGQSESIWPGFRADTIPVALVVQGGTRLYNWTGPLPAGFIPIPGVARAGWRDSAAAGAASTGIRIGERGVAQVVVREPDPAEVIPTAFHEAFHVFQASRRSPGQRFGDGEQSFLISSYPVFDTRNEGLFALEAGILAAALEASGGRARELTRQFVSVRRERLGRLAMEYAQFDRASELNEGLAEYALVRGLELLAGGSGVPESWRGAARVRLAELPARLRQVVADSTQSLRLRYYHTGPAQARLLDRMDRGWKARFIAEDRWLDDVLARASGLDQVQMMAYRAAVAENDSAAVFRTAGAAIQALQQRRQRQVDGLLAGPGVLLVIRADSLPSRDFNPCGFDPQNLLQVSEKVRLHTRWWRPCSGGPTYAEFEVPSVHDSERGTVSAVVPAETEVSLTAGGQPVSLPGEGETLRDLLQVRLVAGPARVEAVRADVSRNGRVITIWPKRPL